MTIEAQTIFTRLITTFLEVETQIFCVNNSPGFIHERCCAQNFFPQVAMFVIHRKSFYFCDTKAHFRLFKRKDFWLNDASQDKIIVDKHRNLSPPTHAGMNKMMGLNDVCRFYSWDVMAKKVTRKTVIWHKLLITVYKYSRTFNRTSSSPTTDPSIFIYNNPWYNNKISY